MAGKTRSPNYPALSLRTALDYLERLWKAEGRAQVSAISAAQSMGFGGLSGPAKVTLGALNQYGLVDRRRGSVRTTDLGVNLLSPPDPERHQGNLYEAATHPELFRDLFMNYVDASENAIRNYLISKRGFAPRGAEVATKAFKETADLMKHVQVAFPERPIDLPPSTVANLKDRKDPQQSISIDMPIRGGILSLRVSVRGSELFKHHITQAQHLLKLAAEGLPDEEPPDS